MNFDLLFVEEKALVGFVPKGFLINFKALFRRDYQSIEDRLNLVNLDRCGYVKSFIKPNPELLYWLKRYNVEYTARKDPKGFYHIILHDFIDLTPENLKSKNNNNNNRK